MSGRFAGLAAWTLGCASLAAQAAGPDGGFPPGTGQPKVQAACGPCHAVNIVTSARKSAAEWESTMSAMITRGARVPDEDFDIILAYLVRNFSARAPDAGGESGRH